MKIQKSLILIAGGGVEIIGANAFTYNRVLRKYLEIAVFHFLVTRFSGILRKVVTGIFHFFKDMHLEKMRTEAEPMADVPVLISHRLACVPLELYKKFTKIA